MECSPGCPVFPAHNFQSFIFLVGSSREDKRPDGDKTLREREKIMWANALLVFFYPESAEGLNLSAN